MNELLMEGLQLMGVGMGVVFLFLGLMVAVVAAVSLVIQKREAGLAKGGQALSDDELRVLFQEAISRYRGDHPN